jgi:glycosyltransferase involved in cell wall biosynthesis
VLTIGLFTDGMGFEGNAIETGPLGGAETCFIQMARTLADLGHQVMAFNNCREPSVHNRVHYYPIRKSLPLLARQNFDIMLVSRFFGFFSLPVKSRLKVLWNHDTLDNAKALRTIHDELDLLLVLSNFHRDNFLTRLPQLEDRTVVTRNGIDFNLLDQGAGDAEKIPGKLIYSSRPERGLRNLLENIWPRLSKARTNLKLYLCGYTVDDDFLEPGLKDLYNHLDYLCQKDPRIINLGPLSKNDYYRHLKEAEMMVYPSTFPEVSCLAVLEAQALGTAVLTSDSYALSESVVIPEFKIFGRPASPAYYDRYVERALKLLSAPTDLESLSQKAKSLIRSRHSWEKIAQEWLRVFDLSIKSKENRANFQAAEPGVSHALMV